MRYKLYTTKSFERAFKKLPVQVQKFIKGELIALEEQPQLGYLLEGRFRFFRSLHLKLKNIQYRAVYSINEDRKEIYLYYVASRENFYTELQRLNLKKII